MKKVTYLLGLLNITLPQRTKQHRDSNGNAFTPVSGLVEAKHFTIIPDVPVGLDEWKQKFNIGTLHSRFVVNPDSTKILNRGTLQLTPEPKTYGLYH